MTVVIFTGPTISAADARADLEADYRAPAAEGDVYRVALERPNIIGIIDGYFERVPSVRHKEILWAMRQGIHVFGAASMGALRAAELAAFGMEGVGTIFEAYRDGRLEDDDELAVAHGTAEHGFRAGSEAMVDIRHTLGRAAEAGVVSPETRVALESAAKSLFYPDRSYASVIKVAASLGLPQSELTALKEWLPSGRASLKRDDAVAMLRVIRERIAAPLEPKRVNYSFESSSMWESGWRLAGESTVKDQVPQAAVVDELRLEGEPFLRAQEAAVLRVLAIKHSYVQGMADSVAYRERAAHRLWAGTGRQEWMNVNHLDEPQLAALLEDEARVGWIKGLAAYDARGYLMDQLRVSGDYPRLVERARNKQVALSAMGLGDAGISDTGLDDRALMRWYFEERLGRAVPADLDAYCAEMGFAGRADLRHTLAREFCYVQGRRAKAGIEG